MTKNVSALSTMTQCATRINSPVVARIRPEKRATRDPKKRFAMKKATRTVANAKMADGILATLSETPSVLNVKARMA